MDVLYRKADISDLPGIVSFADLWLAGNGGVAGLVGVGHDFFVPYGRHKAYLEKYQVLLALLGSEIVGWAVKTKKGVLIHLLVAGTFRHRGIGSRMLNLLRPDVVRSKVDQSAGDPAGFYRKFGFVKVSSARLGKKKNIELFTRGDVVGDGDGEHRLDLSDVPLKSDNGEKGPRFGRRRTIDDLAGRIDLVRKYSRKYSY